MLARSARVTTADDYRAAVRRGARFSAPTVVVYVRRNSESHTRFGFIVSKQVGVAVVRNRVRRRLKAACYAVGPIGDGVDVVIRALPSSADASFAQLHGDVTRALTKASLISAVPVTVAQVAS